MKKTIVITLVLGSIFIFFNGCGLKDGFEYGNNGDETYAVTRSEREMKIISDLTYRFLDFEDNKLMDYLVVTGEVPSLKTGKYVILGELYDVNGKPITIGDLWNPSDEKVSFISRSKYFDEENKGFEMFFNGQHIYESGLSGPYKIAITVIDNDGMSCAEGEIVTKELKFENFQGDLLQINYVTDELTDLVDGRAKTLRFTVDIEARVAGSYYISGNIIKDDNGIQLIQKQMDLKAGSNKIEFDFDTLKLSCKELAGPYSLFIICDLYQTENFDSKNYTLDQLVLPPVYFTGEFQERIVKGTNKNLDLVVDVPLTASVNGNYTIRASLWDSEDNPIDYIYITEAINSAGKVVSFNFDTSNIVNYNLTGPYIIQVSLFDEEDNDLGVRDYKTKAYTYKQFVQN